MPFEPDECLYRACEGGQGVHRGRKCVVRISGIHSRLSLTTSFRCENTTVAMCCRDLQSLVCDEIPSLRDPSWLEATDGAPLQEATDAESPQAATNTESIVGAPLERLALVLEPREALLVDSVDHLIDPLTEAHGHVVCVSLPLLFLVRNDRVQLTHRARELLQAALDRELELLDVAGCPLCQF